MSELSNLLTRLHKMNIQSYYVGGCVRDGFMHIASKDIDICLVGVVDKKMAWQTIKEYADSVTGEVGAQFPVWIADFSGEKIDFALARRENSTGEGHKDFTCTTELVTIYEDLARRDLTINAIAENCITGEIIDPFGGVTDIKQRIARPCTTAFMEDPLRVFRAARFISRFNLSWSDGLVWMCKQVDVTAISAERVGEELEKMFEQANTPSHFFNFLLEVKKIDQWFREVSVLQLIDQDPTWHPEGNVYNHTMHCMDQAKDPFTRAVMLCHDMGKVSTTRINEKGRITARGHAQAGILPALTMLKRIKFKNTKYQKQIVCLVDNHMFHTNTKFTRKNVVGVIRKLQKQGLTFEQLVEVCRCDVSGRPPLPAKTPNIGQSIAKEALEKGWVAPVVTGDMLIEVGVRPGVEMGKMLAIYKNMQDKGRLDVDDWKKHLKSVINSSK